jgi:hypothetical protein
MLPYVDPWPAAAHIRLGAKVGDGDGMRVGLSVGWREGSRVGEAAGQVCHSVLKVGRGSCRCGEACTNPVELGTCTYASEGLWA